MKTKFVATILWLSILSVGHGITLDAVVSATLANAIARQTGRFEASVLPHKYLHLAPLVGTA